MTGSIFNRSKPKPKKRKNDTVNSPRHYNSHPSGIEAIVICETMGFNIGNAVKYLFRCEHKGNKIEDIRKAEWYIKRELQRLEKEAQKKS